MTQEEQKAVEEFTEMNLTKKGLYRYNDMQDAFLIGLFKGEKMQSSLPSNLDEAANDGWAVYEYRESPRGLYSTCYVDGFKAGAEWMAGQGVNSEGKVFTSAFTSYVKTPGIEKLLKVAFPEDTEVIVQIRKK